jgi:hypothetical protein
MLVKFESHSVDHLFQTMKTFSTFYLNSITLVLSPEISDVTLPLWGKIVQAPTPVQVWPMRSDTSGTGWTRDRTSGRGQKPRRPTAWRRKGWRRGRHFPFEKYFFSKTKKKLNIHLYFFNRYSIVSSSPQKYFPVPLLFSVAMSSSYYYDAVLALRNSVWLDDNVMPTTH